jgi:hypothetical protein
LKNGFPLNKKFQKILIGCFKSSFKKYKINDQGLNYLHV